MNNHINSIQVLGSGCPTCKKLFELSKEAVQQLNLDVEVEYITDIQKIIELGLMSSPVLVINGQVALAGSLPNLNQLKDLFSLNNKQTPTTKNNGGCSCGGHC